MNHNKIARKYGLQEYWINSDSMHKLYNMYLEKPMYNKVLDKMVFFSIMIIVMSVVLSYIGDVNPTVLFLLNSISATVIGVFALELLRFYMHSHSAKEFFKKHWVDFILIVFLSFYFFFVAGMGLLKVKGAEALYGAAEEGKHMRSFWMLATFRRNKKE